METKAHHVVIGAFTLGVIALTFLFVGWLSQAQFDARFETYEIVFERNVSGLSSGAPVFYNGIKVGEVTAVGLDPADPSKVQVLIQVDALTPVNVDTLATLDVGILTGVGVIQLAGGTAQSARLTMETRAGESAPRILAGESQIEKIFAGVPDLLAQGDNVLARLAAFMSPANEQAFSGILSDIRTVTSALAKNAEAIDQFVQNANIAAEAVASATRKVDSIAASLDSIAKNADEVVEKDVRAVLKEATASLASLDALLRELERAAAENRGPINDFTSGGLPQFVAMVQDARQLMVTLDRVFTKFESDPAAFLFGNEAAEYETPSR